jgi:two-component system, OmpR family, sensor histidine kinase TctE
MIGGRFRSLQLRLAVRLALLYVAATMVGVGVLVYQAYDTADTLNDRELSLRAADLARYVSVDAGGMARLDLSPKLAASYETGSDADLFAIRGPDDRIIAASPPSFGETVAKWPAPTDDPSYFRLKNFGAAAQEYYGLSVQVGSAAGPLSVFVARAAGADALVHSLLREFLLDIAWIIPLLVIVTLAIGVLAIRSGLKPVREVSAMASTIGPSATSVRLPDRNLPSEIKPLVVAVNRALDRLEQGFTVQRQFTANAAHELRTPLAIITGALDTIDGNEQLTTLKADVARMNRLVQQLLRVARLDAIALDVSGSVDLNEVAIEVVATMAPWALTQGREIALERPESPVNVKGNGHAIGDAVRNLVENAVAHAPLRSEITVITNSDGSVSVSDHGPGIVEEERQRIFERFWRGQSARSQGAGLGLAIVKEIMKAHGGSIGIDENVGGGSVFTLRFKLTQPASPGQRI